MFRLIVSLMHGIGGIGLIVCGLLIALGIRQIDTPTFTGLVIILLGGLILGLGYVYLKLER